MLQSENEQEVVDELGASTGSVILFMIFVPLVVGIALKGLQAKLWAMLNTYQLINELSILSIQLPANVSNVQKHSIDIINFNPIPKDLIHDWMFDKQEKFPESDKLKYQKALRMLEAAVVEEEQTAEDVYASIESQGEMIKQFKLTEQ